LFFYSKEGDASIGQNSLENNTLRFQNTFLRAENDEGCYGTGQFDIIVEPIQNQNFWRKNPLWRIGPSIILQSGILFPALTADYAYAWSTGETTFHRSIKEGDYTVVTNEAGCSETRTTSLYLILLKYKI
jgi:hypothetical protein